MTHTQFKYYLRDRGYAATLADAALMMDNMIMALRELMVDGEPVTWKGFGTFCVKDHKGHRIRSVQGKEMEVPTCKTMKFIPSEILKRQVREGFIRE